MTNNGPRQSSRPVLTQGGGCGVSPKTHWRSIAYFFSWFWRRKKTSNPIICKYKLALFSIFVQNSGNKTSKPLHKQNESKSKKIRNMWNLELAHVDKFSNLHLDNVDKLWNLQLGNVNKFRNEQLHNVDKFNNLHLDKVDKLWNLQLGNVKKIRNEQLDNVDKFFQCGIGEVKRSHLCGQNLSPKTVTRYRNNSRSRERRGGRHYLGGGALRKSAASWAKAPRSPVAAANGRNARPMVGSCGWKQQWRTKEN